MITIYECGKILCDNCEYKTGIANPKYKRVWKFYCRKLGQFYKIGEKHCKQFKEKKP